MRRPLSVLGLALLASTANAATLDASSNDTEFSCVGDAVEIAVQGEVTIPFAYDYTNDGWEVEASLEVTTDEGTYETSTLDEYGESCDDCGISLPLWVGSVSSITLLDSWGDGISCGTLDGTSYVQIYDPDDTLLGCVDDDVSGASSCDTFVADGCASRTGLSHIISGATMSLSAGTLSASGTGAAALSPSSVAYGDAAYDPSTGAFTFALDPTALEPGNYTITFELAGYDFGDTISAEYSFAITESDGDGVCDDVDICDGDDSYGDSDTDGVCDSSDICYGSDATGDTDADGTCDDLDVCPLDELDDSDGDGSCDTDDLCTGDDAFGDDDGDGICDCEDLDVDGICDDDGDLCFGDDTTLDRDRDGICGDQDLCLGDDEGGDRDGDGLCEANLSAPPPRPGELLPMRVDDARPNSMVFFMVTGQGVGTGLCHPTIPVCVDLNQPTILGSARANMEGTAEFDIVVPNLPPGLDVFMQAVWVDIAANEGEMTDVVVRRLGGGPPTP